MRTPGTIQTCHIYGDDRGRGRNEELRARMKVSKSLSAKGAVMAGYKTVDGVPLYLGAM
jgi:hypothetical protein